MPTKVVKSVNTKPIGFAPILASYFQKCGIVDIIDEHVSLDPRRKVLTHGEACMSMVTGILFQVMQLYRICQFARESDVLDVLLPGISPEEYFDDRLADTLDAIYRYGLDNLEIMITRQMIDTFKIKTDICHNDTTCAFTYGDCDTNQTDKSIDITFGYSKHYRNDLKQLVWSLTVSSDHAFPLFQQAYNGNTGDVETYIEQWNRLIDLLGERDFLFAGDSKVASKENMAYIHDNEGYFVCPLPMYATYRDALFAALEQHDSEMLLPYKKGINRGFEVPLDIEYEGKSYTFRMIVLFDHGKFLRKSKSLSECIAKSKAAFAKLSQKLNAYRLKTEPAIDKACQKILDKYQTTDFFDYQITNDPVVTYKNSKRGRPSKNDTGAKVEVVKDCFRIEWQFDERMYEEALYRMGYYPLVTNKPHDDFSIEDAMMAYKNQYKVEHAYRRSKSGYKLEPIYLHTPDRVESYLFLFKIALQIIVLIERNARNNIKSRDRGLDDFMPNKTDYRIPRTEYLLQKFEHVVSGTMHLPDGDEYAFVSELTDLQRDILEILEVPLHFYSYSYLFDSS